MYMVTITSETGQILDAETIAKTAAQVGSGAHEAYDEEDGLWLINLATEHATTLEDDGFLEITVDGATILAEMP
jgi:hypothetical protein